MDTIIQNWEKLLADEAEVDALYRDSVQLEASIAAVRESVAGEPAEVQGGASAVLAGCDRMEAEQRDLRQRLDTISAAVREKRALLMSLITDGMLGIGVVLSARAYASGGLSRQEAEAVVQLGVARAQEIASGEQSYRQVQRLIDAAVAEAVGVLGADPEAL